MLMKIVGVVMSEATFLISSICYYMKIYSPHPSILLIVGFFLIFNFFFYLFYFFMLKVVELCNQSLQNIIP